VKDNKEGCFTVILIFVMAAFYCSAQAAEKIQYKLNLKQGDKYYFKTTTKYNISKNVMGHSNETESTLGYGLLMEVNEIDQDNNIWLRQSYNWVKYVQPMKDGIFDYDSTKDNPTNASEGFFLKAFLGESVLVEIAPDGGIINLKNTDRMRNRIYEKIKKLSDNIAPYFQVKGMRMTAKDVERLRKFIKRNMERNNFNPKEEILKDLRFLLN
jgi:hypothetical protein